MRVDLPYSTLTDPINPHLSKGLKCVRNHIFQPGVVTHTQDIVASLQFARRDIRPGDLASRVAMLAEPASPIDLVMASTTHIGEWLVEHQHGVRGVTVSPTFLHVLGLRLCVGRPQRCYMYCLPVT